MALTATFAADFDSFTKNLRDATVKLQVFDRETKNASRSMRKELESISGQKVAAEAARMAEAVKRLGGEGGTAAGLLKLTDAELKRFTSTMDAAADKAARLGETLPDSLKKAREEIAKLPKPTDDAAKSVGLLDSTFAKLTASFTVASLIDKGITSVVSFGHAAFESAGQIIDLSNKTGLSTRTIQQMQAVASQTGSSLDAFTSAAYKLGINIATGTKDAREAVDALGLSFRQLQSSTPDEQFAQAVRALEQVESVTERNRLGQALFGKQWAEIAAGVADGYSDIADAAGISSDAQLQALDRAGDAWDAFKNSVTTQVRGLLGEMVLLSAGLKEAAFAPSAEDFKIFAILAATGAPLPAILAQIAAKHAEATKAQANARKDIELTVPVLEDYVAKLAAVQDELNELKPATKTQLDAAIKFGATYEEVAKSISISEEAFNQYKGAIASGETALKAADSATAAWNDSLAKNKTELQKAAREVALFIDATNRALASKGGATPSDFTAKIESLNKPATDAILANAKLQAKYQADLTTLVRERTLDRVQFQIAEIERWAANEKAVLDTTAGAWEENARLIDSIAVERAQNVLLSTEEVQDAIGMLAAMLPGLAPGFTRFFEAGEKGADGAAKSTKKWDDGLGELARSLSQMADIAGDSFGPVLRDLAGVVASADVTNKSVGQMKTGWTELTKESGNVAKGLTDIATGAIGAAAAFMQAVQSGSAFQATLSGAQLGASLGAINPWVGALGAGAGALAGYLIQQEEAQKKARRALNEMREELRRLESVQDEIAAGTEDWAIDLIAVRDLLLSVGENGDRAESIMQRLWDTEHPERVAEAIGDINDLMSQQERQWDAAREAMETFGISAEEMGTAFRQHEFDTEAASLLEQLNALVAVGVPLETIMARAGDQVGEFVHRSIEAGTRVPLEFQPIVQKMIEAGALIDKNGEKFTDMSQIPWADNINRDLQDLTKAIQDLNTSLAGIGKMFGSAAMQAEGAAHKMVASLGDVEEAVNAVNFGHSPGGLKEIPILLDAAVAAMGDFRASAMSDLSAVYGGFDNLFMAMGQFNEGLSFQRMGALKPDAESEIARLEAQIDRLRDQDGSSGDSALRQMKRDLEDFNTTARDQLDMLEEQRDRAVTKADKTLADKRIEDFRRQADAQRKVMDAAITVEERRLEDLRGAIDRQVDELERRIEQLKQQKNPLEGFPLPPTMLNAEQAIAQVNQVFQRYFGQNANGGQLGSIAQAIQGAITPQGTISQDILTGFLQRMIETYFESQFNPGFFANLLTQAQEGFPNGTMGRYGEWFHDFKGGRPVVLHREEAVISKPQARAFAEDVLGGRGGSGLNEDRLASKIGSSVRGSLAGLLAEERYKAALANRDASVGAV